MEDFITVLVQHYVILTCLNSGTIPKAERLINATTAVKFGIASLLHHIYYTIHKGTWLCNNNAASWEH